MSLVYAGILLCAAAFTIVAVFASVALKRAANTMESFTTTLGDVEQKMNHITPELQKMLKETGRTTDDLNDKLAATNGLFDSLDRMGHAVHTCNRLLQTKTNKLSVFRSPQFVNKLTETLKWGGVVNQIYNRWKNGQKGSNTNRNEQKTGNEG
ncbi:hypothetical protein GCM10008983_09040 [Lentibacillus halophilus]|uniref:DUF948 domain-containing protein n=1 Tax=Lentibacillus halophilus TaxID=295065 RepID=A0ABP3IZE9_9BACI